MTKKKFSVVQLFQFELFDGQLLSDGLLTGTHIQVSPDASSTPGHVTADPAECRAQRLPTAKRLSSTHQQDKPTAQVSLKLT